MSECFGFAYPERVFSKECRRCGAAFQTRSLRKKRCDPCQTALQASRQVGYSAKWAAKRRKAVTP